MEERRGMGRGQRYAAAGMLLTFFSCFFLAAGDATPCGTDSNRGIKVFVTSDIHGNIFENPGKRQIGFARLLGYMDAARRDGYEAVLMDAGDAFSGSAVAQFDSGRSVAAAMGRMGYRILSPGNHAFDYNAFTGDSLYYPNTLLHIVREMSDGPFAAVCLNLAVDGASVPGIAMEPVVVSETNGIRLVACGVLTPYAGRALSPSSVLGYDFGLVEREGAPDHAATRAAIHDRLRSAVCRYDRPGDIVLVLSHVGCDDTPDYANGEIGGRDFACIPNVDIVVDAHSHNFVPAQRICRAWYGNPGRYLEHVVEITITREGEDIRTVMEIRDYADLANVRESAAMLDFLRSVSDRLGLGDRLFQLGEELSFTDAGIQEGSTVLGRFLCREMAAATGADLALYNSGGIRAGFVPGWVTVGDIYDSIPFQNNLVVASMTGAEIHDLFDPMPDTGTNAFPQLYGMTVYAWPDDGALRAVGILDRDGLPLAPERTYDVALNSFMLYGGDGYVFSTATAAAARDHGDCVVLLVNSLRGRDAIELEALAENRALLVFPDRSAAEDAWDAARTVFPEI